MCVAIITRRQQVPGTIIRWEASNFGTRQNCRYVPKAGQADGWWLLRSGLRGKRLSLGFGGRKEARH